MVRVRSWLNSVVLGACVLWLGACSSTVIPAGGETNWICESDSDCSGPSRCVARRCAAPDAGPSAASATGSGGHPSDGGAAAGRAGDLGTSPLDSGSRLGAGAGGGGATGNPCGIDYAALSADSGPPVSLRADVMPIFGASCTASDCHDSQDKKAGLDLGVRCRASGSGASFACTFPTVADPNPTSTNPPMPLTEDVVNRVYASLLSDSTTVTGPTVKNVVPYDPAHSFLVDKMVGTQNAHGYTCVNQDPSHTTNPQPCGDGMPLASPLLCAGSRRPDVDLVVRWIAQGAQND